MNFHKMRRRNRIGSFLLFLVFSAVLLFHFWFFFFKLLFELRFPNEFQPLLNYYNGCFSSLFLFLLSSIFYHAVSLCPLTMMTPCVTKNCTLFYLSTVTQITRNTRNTLIKKICWPFLWIFTFRKMLLQKQWCTYRNENLYLCRIPKIMT